MLWSDADSPFGGDGGIIVVETLCVLILDRGFEHVDLSVPLLS